ncbi:hypothetical protein PINS_up015766 [Pythium insidiosum]|nr:hypothetical protein PINS_up015766 [Pythium insidiosum]
MRSNAATITVVVSAAMASNAGASVVTHSGLTLVDTPSAVRQVSFDGQSLCAVTAQQSVICRFNAATASQWKTVYASHAAWINVAGNSLWAMDEWSTPHYSTANATSSWTNAKFTISTAFISDRRAICQLAFNKMVYCAPESGGNIQQWLAAMPSVSTRSLDVWQSTVVGIDVKGAVYTAQWPAERLAVASPIAPSTGPYQSIATDGDFTCATKETTETVFCYHNSTGDWQPIAAKFTQITLREARLYGVAGNGTLWTTTLKLASNSSVSLAALKTAEREAEDSINAEYTRELHLSRLQQVETPTSIERVSYDGSHLCVTVKSQTAMCANFKPNERLHWFALEKELKSVAAARDIIWGVTRDDKVWSRPLNLTALWTRAEATWSAVASDGKMVCGINAEDAERQTLRCSLKGAPAASDDLYDMVTLQEVGVAPNGTIYGVTTDKGVYDFTPSDFPGATEQIRSVASDGNIRCTSSEASPTVTCVSRKSNRFATRDANLAHLVMSSGRLFGVAPNGTLWTMRVALKAKDDSSADIDDENRDIKDSKLNPAPVSSGVGSGYIVAAVVGGVALLGAIAFFIYRSHHHTRSKKEAMTDSQPTEGDSDLIDVTPSSSADAVYRSTSKSPTGKRRRSTLQGRSNSLGDWMNDPAFLCWRIPRKQLAFEGLSVVELLEKCIVVAMTTRTLPSRCWRRIVGAFMLEIEEFAKEALFLTVLKHDRIVRLIGVAWTTPSDLCIVSELMNGGDVLDLLRQYQRDGQPQGFTKFKATIALHVAEALVYLHSQSPKLLHRDLKSKNIMLTETGDAKLTDFGVARTWEDLTLTAGVGSLLWMAPEVVFGDRYDEKADIYSFGVVLSELDTHELPFSGDTRVPELAICQLVAAGELCVKFSDCAIPEVRALGERCMELNPSKRPSANDVLLSIQCILERLHV